MNEIELTRAIQRALPPSNYNPAFSRRAWRRDRKRITKQRLKDALDTQVCVGNIQPKESGTGYCFQCIRRPASRKKLKSQGNRVVRRRYDVPNGNLYRRAYELHNRLM